MKKYLFLILIGACTFKKGPSIKRLRIRFAAEVPTIDPALSTDTTSGNIIETMNDALIYMDQSNRLVPALAESWTVSADHKTYTFKLRSGILWTDGKPVVAQQFVDAAERALTQKNGVVTSSFLLPIENAKDFYDGKLADFSKVSIQASDEKTLVIKLKESMPYWINVAAFPVLMPLRKEILAKYGDRWIDPKNFVSTGAYRLVEKNIHGTIRCEKNPLYWNQESLKGAFESVEFRIVEDGNTAVNLFRQGEFDIVDGVPSQLVPILDKTEPALVSLHSLFVSGIAMRVDKVSVRNTKVRQALAMSIDRKALQKLLHRDSEILESWIPPELMNSKEGQALVFNPIEAKKLWSQAKNAPKKLEYLYPSGSRTNMIAQFLQQQWKENLGVEIDLFPQEWRVYLKARFQGEFPIFQQNWLADYPDAMNFLEIFTCSNEQNTPHMCNKTYDALLSQSARVQSEEERQKLFKEAEKILLQQEAAIIPLTREDFNYLIHPRIKNFSINRSSKFRVANLRLAE